MTTVVAMAKERAPTRRAAEYAGTAHLGLLTTAILAAQVIVWRSIRIYYGVNVNLVHKVSLNTQRFVRLERVLEQQRRMP